MLSKIQKFSREHFRCVGIHRNQLSPGPERRWGDRCSEQRDRGERIDEPGPGREQFYLDNSSGSGPSLKYNGVAVVPGQFAANIVPIGAEVTATGYEVAWKVLGTNQYSVWRTDSNGNYVSNIIGTASATDPALESIETSFHQDLNGDGVIGVPSSLSFSGATSAVSINLRP
jgi:Tryptophan-rich Synechocystis species C-terminal domain